MSPAHATHAQLSESGASGPHSYSVVLFTVAIGAASVGLAKSETGRRWWVQWEYVVEESIYYLYSV